MLITQSWAEAQRILAVKNVSGEEVPPFAAMIVTGYDLQKGLFEVDKPDEDNATCDVLFNVGGPIANDKVGSGTADYPCRALVNGFTSGVCGVIAGAWYLSDTKAGFLAHGGETDDDGNDFAFVSKCV